MSSSLSHIGQATSEMLRQIIERLLRETYGEDQPRRGDDRIAMHCPLTLGVNLGGPEAYKALHRAWATDLSMGGLGLLTEDPMEPGLQMWANLESIAGVRCVVPIRIVYNKQLLPHTYRIGAVFLLED